MTAIRWNNAIRATRVLRDSERIVGHTEVRAEQCVVQEGYSPSGAQMRASYPKAGGSSLAGRRKQKVWRRLNGHESENWIQPRRTWSRCLLYSGGQGVHRGGFRRA